MNKLEINLNVLHYCIYRAHYKLHLMANKVNPFWLLAKLPFLKKRYKELGIDINMEINKAFSNSKYGLSIIVAGGLLFCIVFFVIFDAVHILIHLIDNNISLSIGYFIVFGIISFALCYLFVFEKDRYLFYFKEFESWTKSEKIKHGLLSLCFTLLVVIMFFLPFFWHWK